MLVVAGENSQAPAITDSPNKHEWESFDVGQFYCNQDLSPEVGLKSIYLAALNYYMITKYITYSCTLNQCYLASNE